MDLEQPVQCGLVLATRYGACAGCAVYVAPGWFGWLAGSWIDQEQQDLSSVLSSAVVSSRLARNTGSVV